MHPNAVKNYHVAVKIWQEIFIVFFKQGARGKLELQFQVLFEIDPHKILALSQTRWLSTPLQVFDDRTYNLFKSNSN